MKRCYKCNSRMVRVDLVDRRGQTSTALICTYCGHIYSQDRPFKKEWRAG